MDGCLQNTPDNQELKFYLTWLLGNWGIWSGTETKVRKWFKYLPPLREDTHTHTHTCVYTHTHI